MWKWTLAGIGLLAVVLFGASLVDLGGGQDVSASAALLSAPEDVSGYARAIDPYPWQFPADYGPHPDFQTEWWYYTGNLADESGRRFGFQFTIFRRALSPQAAVSDSDWRTNQVYMAHLTLTDVAANQFYEQQRFSRGAAGLAGATVEPVYRVWLEDWQVIAEDAAATHTRITAAGEGIGLDLALEQIKPPALNGDEGLSPKSAEPGNASYYYSLSRLVTEGALTVGDQTYAVTGTTWQDHEFSTSALGADAQGWDWFGLQFDDGRELMLGQIRLVNGGIEPVFGGTLIEADGGTRHIASGDFTLDVTGTWTSPHTGAIYPAGWAFSVDVGEAAPLRFTLTPLIAEQELHQGIAYWEGAVRIAGDVSGYGYAELTGYAGTMNGRF